MKQLAVIILSVLLSFNALSQNDYFTVITIKGNVQHESKEGDLSQVVPGAKISVEGKLHLEDKSMIKIISGKRPQKLQTKGIYDLQELYFSDDKKSMSFTGKFWKYLTEGLEKTDTKENLRAYGSKLVAGGIKGYNSTATSEIPLLSPIVGDIAIGDLTFKWQPTDKSKSSTLIIKTATGDVLAEETTSASELTLNMSELGAKAGQYHWSVTNSDKISSIVNFNYVPSPDISTRLSRITDYVEGDASEKQWIEAVVLDMEGRHYEASLILQALIAKKPNQLLYKKLYALNQVRLGNLDKAAATID